MGGLVWGGATSLWAAARPIVPGSVAIGLEQVVNVGGPAISLTPGPDGRLYVCTLDGKVRAVSGGTATTVLDLAAISAVSFLAGGANGLYGIAFHPGFGDPASPGFRKCYTYGDERKFASGNSGPLTGLPDFWPPERYAPGTPAPSVSNYALATFGHFNVLREWTATATAPVALDPASSRVVLRLAHPASPGHNGTGPRFGPDGLLYLAVGDGGGSGNDHGGGVNHATDGHANGTGNAQDLTNPFGKVLRIDPLPGGAGGTLSANGQYRIPPGHPLADGAGGRMDEIFAYGFRNPWGFSWDDRAGGDGRLYLANVGHHHREEINVIVAGGNYGWGYLEGSVPLLAADNYSGESLPSNIVPVRTPPGGLGAFSSILPLAEYKTRRQYGPDGAATIAANLTGDGTAATGGFVYRGTAIAGLVGRYVFGDYAVSETAPPPGFATGQARMFHLDPAETAPAILEFSYAAGTVVPGFLLGFGQDAAGELYSLFANGDVKKLVPASAPPDIAVSPAAQTVAAGGAAVFSAAPRGTGPFTYQWSFNGTLLAGATGATLTVASAQTFHAGAYRVVATDAVGVTSTQAAALRVETPASDGRLLNLSTRGFVGTGDAVLISGLVISGGAKTLLLRAVGPTLEAAPFNVTGVLSDPKLTIYSGATPILQNDDWGAHPEAARTALVAGQVGAFPLPAESRDAALVVTLPAGNYTVQASAANGTATGIALVEVYEAP